MNKNIDAKSLVIGALVALLGMMMMGSTASSGNRWTASITTVSDRQVSAIVTDGSRVYFQGQTYSLAEDKWIDVTPGESKQGGFR